MAVAYRLKNNTRFIEQVQRATKTTKKFGIEPTHGLFGTEEWWAQIAAGELQIYSLQGVISKVYMGSMNDWPMFDLLSDAGQTSNWTREVNWAEQDKLYREGRRIEVDYVLQRSRPSSWSQGAEQKQVLEIRIAETVDVRALESKTDGR